MAKSKLTKKQKRNYLIIGAVAVLLVVLYMWNSGDEEKENPKSLLTITDFSLEKTSAQKQIPNTPYKSYNNPFVITGIPSSVKVGDKLSIQGTLEIFESCGTLVGTVALYKNQIGGESESEKNEFRYNTSPSTAIITEVLDTSPLSEGKYILTHDWVCDDWALGKDGKKDNNFVLDKQEFIIGDEESDKKDSNLLKYGLGALGVGLILFALMRKKLW